MGLVDHTLHYILNRQKSAQSQQQVPPSRNVPSNRAPAASGARWSAIAAGKLLNIVINHLFLIFSLLHIVGILTQKGF